MITNHPPACACFQCWQAAQNQQEHKRAVKDCLVVIGTAILALSVVALTVTWGSSADCSSVIISALDSQCSYIGPIHDLSFAGIVIGPLMLIASVLV